MHQTELRYALIFFSILIAFVSCVPQKKAVSVKHELSTIDSQLLKYGETLNELEVQLKDKQTQNEMDDTAGSHIQTFINKTNAEIDTLVDQNSILIGDVVVNRADWERLQKSLVFTQNTSKKLNKKVLLISDLVSRNTVVKIDQDVLFKSGQYTVAPEMADVIGKIFEPAAREIDQLVKKYPDFPLSLVINAKGYADGTSIAEGSPLYNDLKERLKLNGAEPDAKEINKELSRARAEKVRDLFKKYFSAWSENGNNVKNTLIIFEGKGEAFPDPTISNYKIDDPRRRVVLLFWSIFPE